MKQEIQEFKNQMQEARPKSKGLQPSFIKKPGFIKKALNKKLTNNELNKAEPIVNQALKDQQKKPNNSITTKLKDTNDLLPKNQFDFSIDNSASLKPPVGLPSAKPNQQKTK